MRKDPVINPFEATVKLQDLRGAPNRSISFLDVCDLMEEEMSDFIQIQNSSEIAKKIQKSKDIEYQLNEKVPAHILSKKP